MNKQLKLNDVQLSKKIVIHEFKIKPFLTYKSDRGEMLVNAHWRQECEDCGVAQISPNFWDQLGIFFPN